MARLVEYDGASGVNERFFRFLARTRCDVVMGVPIDSRYPDPPAGLAATRGYFEARYVLVTLHRVRTVAGLRAGSTVAVQMATVPHFYLAGAFGAKPPLHADVYDSQQKALHALTDGTDASAMVWLPSVVQYEIGHPKTRRIFVSALPIPRNRFELAAIYDPANAAFAKRFDAALQALKNAGQLTTEYDRLGLEDFS